MDSYTELPNICGTIAEMALQTPRKLLGPTEVIWHCLQVSRLGVTSILVPSGLSLQLFEKGLKQYAAEHANGKTS